MINAEDLTAVRIEAVGGYALLADATQPGVERIGGARLYPAPLESGLAIVADSRYIAVAVRRDASVTFSH